MKSVKFVKSMSIIGGVAVLLLVSFCGLQLPNINTQYSVRQFFPKDHPALVQGDEMAKKFQLKSNPAFFGYLDFKNDEKGSWLEPSRMADLKRIDAAMNEIQGVKQVLSLASVQTANTVGKELRIGTLADSLPADQWTEAVDSQALLQPQLISKDHRTVLIMVEPGEVTGLQLDAISKRVADVLADVSDRYTTGVAGVPAVQIRLADKLSHEVGRYMILCLVIFIFMFALFYKNISPVIFTGIGLLVCNIIVVGMLAYFQIPFTVLLSTLPVMVSVAFVSIAIHTLHLWADNLTIAGNPSDFMERWRLAWKTHREILRPNTLGSLTTAIGFATLATTTLPAIRSYALTVAGSVMVTLVLTQIVLYITLPWITPRQREWTKRRAWWMIWITKRATPIVVIVISVSIVMASSAKALNFSAKLFDDLPANESIRTSMLRIDKQFGGTVDLDFAIDGGHDHVWTEPAMLNKLQKVASEIRQLPNMGSALVITDFMGAKIPDTTAGVAEVQFLYSMSPVDPLSHFLDANGRMTRIAMRISDLESSDVDHIRDNVRSIIMRDIPEGSLVETGLAVNSHVMNREIAKDLLFGFWQSVAIIGVLLVIVFRSLRWAIIACIPNLVPPAILVGTLAIFQTPVKPAVALIFSIALGLAFNNTVYLLSRLIRMRDEKELKFLPLRRTLLDEGNPCLSESLLTFTGFLIFLSSDFKLNQIFGAYMVLSIVAGALGDLVFLPALLKTFAKSILGQVNDKVVKPVNEHLVQPVNEHLLQPMNEQLNEHIVKPVNQHLVKPMNEHLMKPMNNQLNEHLVKPVNEHLVKPVNEHIVQPVNEKVIKPTRDKFNNIKWIFMIGFFLLAALPTAKAAVGGNGQDLLKKARAKLESRSDQAIVTLKIIEPNGDVKTREMQLQTLREGNNFHAIIRIQTPADIKGTALLAELKDGVQSQWLYTPSNQEVRRVISPAKSNGILGSELSADDLNSEALKGATSKLLSQDAKAAQIEIKPRPGVNDFTKVVVTLMEPQNVPTLIEYYDGAKVKKRVEFADYQTVSGVDRAKRIIVKNMVNNRGTEVLFANLKVNLPLKATDFSVNELKKGD